VKYDRVKYDWSSRNAATLAMVSLAAYYLWRGISGHLVIFVFGANIVAIVVASLLGGSFFGGDLLCLCQCSALMPA